MRMILGFGGARCVSVSFLPVALFFAAIRGRYSSSGSDGGKGKSHEAAVADLTGGATHLRFQMEKMGKYFARADQVCFFFFFFFLVCQYCKWTRAD